MSKRILVINFFPAFVPPQSGGELRYFNMYLHLSEYYDITLLSPTYRNHKYEVITHSQSFREYRVPKEEINDLLHMKIDQEKICSEISALVCFETAGYGGKYHEIYHKLYLDADIIIHEFPYMVNFDLYFGMDDKMRIYNSHNFESHLVQQMWKGEHADKYLQKITSAEKKLVCEADLVFATSEEEKCAFINLLGGDTKKIKLAPNGIDTHKYRHSPVSAESGNRKKAFFIGSAHPPNIEAVQFIIDQVAPKCPDIDFLIAGKCCDGFESGRNVQLLGLIGEDNKKKLFETCDLAINPMFAGAGTNLKTLEFMSAGLPLISTEIGARGLGLNQGEHFICAQKENFADILLNAVSHPERLNTVAANGREAVNQMYSWESICARVHQEIETVFQKRTKKSHERKRIFFLNDFEIRNPIAGGEVRCFNLINNLSEYYDVTYLCLNNENRVWKDIINEHFLYLSLPKTTEHLDETNRVNSKFWISTDDIITSYMVQKNDLVMSAVRILYGMSDVIVLEHPYMAKTIERLHGKKVVYESHNFETKLKTELLECHPLKEKLVKAVSETEQLALAKASLLVCVSENEISQLQNFSKRNDLWTAEIKNGVAVPEELYDYSLLKEYFGGRRLITFVGSGHAPNYVAASFIVKELAPQFPNEVFLILGGVGDSIRNEIHTDNVVAFGKVSEEHKHFILYASDVAVNPMESGAGSNLKLAEYFAHKILTVTTPTGARGYLIRHGMEAVIAEKENFADELRNVLDGKYDSKQITENAFRYVEHELSWDILAKKYHECIENYLFKKKLLVYTYRYNIPPRGGAEVYVFNVLSRIASRGNYYIDIATTNVGDMQEQFRFSNSYTEDDDCTSAIPNVCVHKFPIQNTETNTRWKYCLDIYKQFNNESHRIADRFLDIYPHALFMGGWYYPENDGNGAFQCWTSNLSKICVKQLKCFKLSGYAPRKTRLKILLDQDIYTTKMVQYSFDITIPLHSNDVLTLECSTFTIENQDPRQLGIIVKKVIGINNKIETVLDFANDYKNFLRKNKLGEFISSYIELAQKRPDEINDMFYQVRGPLSHVLNEWTEANIEKYDVVLGHSTPFDTLIDAQRIAEAHSRPIVLLPHFHMEDEFYHWHPYYHAFSNAAATICFPAAAKENFFDKINAKCTILPGGGIETGEFQNINKNLIDSIPEAENPFILVLGRKAGAKNYKWVIEAVNKLNQTGMPLRLLMIGKDEDGEPIHSPYVTYLGMQPREMVLSALKRCEFVVNMSESESFGIVILEAWMACKTIIVNENCKAFTELVTDGENGIYANQQNLSEKIRHLFTFGAREEMAQAGFERAVNEYTWEQLAERIENLLDKVSNGGA